MGVFPREPDVWLKVTGNALVGPISPKKDLLMKFTRRRKNLVDFEVQTCLLKRVAIHWLLFMSVNALALYGWTFLLVGAEGELQAHLTYFLRLYFPVLVVSVLLLPVLLLDTSKLSNRFVGPIVRVRKTLALAVKGEAVQPVKFRENDFYGELAKDLNAVLKLQPDFPPPIDSSATPSVTSTM
jgi:hypothetical protein